MQAPAYGISRVSYRQSKFSAMGVSLARSPCHVDECPPSVPDACTSRYGSVPTRKWQRKHQPTSSLSISLRASKPSDMRVSSTRSPYSASGIFPFQSPLKFAGTMMGLPARRQHRRLTKILHNQLTLPEKENERYRGMTVPDPNRV